MKIQLLAPRKDSVEAAQIIDEMINTRRHHALTVFAEETMSWLGVLSQKLLNNSAAKNFPELQALGFWLRPAALKTMKENAQQGIPKDCVLAPRGIVFHVPPANVDTISLYTLALGLLGGNANIVRISERAGPATQLLIGLMDELLADVAPELAAHIRVVSYPHSDEITAHFSRAADTRLLWGGDATVQKLKSIPAGLHTEDLLFPDRFSLCAMDSAAYQKLDTAARDKLAARYANDLFWFDQMACAAPRAHIWIGSAQDGETAADDFFPRVVKASEQRALNIDAGGSVARLSSDYMAMNDLPVTRRKSFGPRLTVLSLSDLVPLGAFKPVNYGHGMLIESVLPTLNDLARFAERRDQTLTHFGLTDAQLKDFALACHGRGFDRIVPVGEALTFSTVWDGYDLLHSMTRRVQIQTDQTSR